jgi:hypothetical protein
MSIENYVESYQKSTQAFIEAVELITPGNIDKADYAGWTPRQIVHHMADSESQSASRLRRILAEPGSQILGYDENMWSEAHALGYTELPIEASLAVYVAARASSLQILGRITDGDLKKFAIHSERGEFSVESWLQVYGKHPLDHANQLREAIAE